MERSMRPRPILAALVSILIGLALASAGPPRWGRRLGAAGRRLPAGLLIPDEEPTASRRHAVTTGSRPARRWRAARARRCFPAS